MTFTLKQSHGAIRKQTFDTITLITENMESIADKLGFEVRMEDIGSGTLADFVSKYRSEIKTYDEWKEKEAVIDSIQRSRIEERRGDSIVINELPEEIFETLKSCTEPSLN